MQTRQLGNSDLQITRVGYGAWAIGGSGWQFAWGSQDDNESIGAIHRALELGVNWIDTAAVYGLGHSEEVIVRALKQHGGAKPSIFTNAALRWDNKGQVQKILKAESIRKEVETACGAYRLMSLISIKFIGRPIPTRRSFKRDRQPWPT
jgi:aryl-alcohol dehydrogenase-like predicted oxidoreductase